MSNVFTDLFMNFCINLRLHIFETSEELEKVVENLDPTEDGEPSEKTHGASS